MCILPPTHRRCRFHRLRQPQQQSANGDTGGDTNTSAKNTERGGGGGSGDSDYVVRSGMVIDRDPRGLGYLARFEAAPPAGFSDELVPWESVIAIK